MRCEKLGLERHNESIVSKLWSLLDESDVDYTMFWRLLYDSIEQDDVVPSFDSIQYAFYEEPSSKPEWNEWLSNWKQEIVCCDSAREKMRIANPKYIPREWMLVKAYVSLFSLSNTCENNTHTRTHKGTKTQRREITGIEDLQKLLENPYESQSKNQKRNTFENTHARNRPGVSLYDPRNNVSIMLTHASTNVVNIWLCRCFLFFLDRNDNGKYIAKY